MSEHHRPPAVWVSQARLAADSWGYGTIFVDGLDLIPQRTRLMSAEHYETMNVDGGRHVKMWTRGVPVEAKAKEQLANTARMPFIFNHLAAMPDVHLGIGATVGSVV